MAALPRCLCLLLTLLMVSSRPTAAIKTRSTDSSPWWGTKEALQIQRSAQRYRAAGNYAAAEGVDRLGYDLAKRRHDSQATIRFLIGIGGCRLAQFHYRAALDSFLEARALAASISDWMDLGAVAVNLSSLYLEVWDFDSALQVAEEGRAAGARLIHPYFEASLLLQLARLHNSLGDRQADRFYAEGIEAARAQSDVALEATGWDLLGAERLESGALEDAEQAFDEAFRLRLSRRRADLPFSYARLGALKLAQGDLDAARAFTDRAIAEGALSNASMPAYVLKHQRGQIRLARGERTAALEDFASAVILAAE